MLMFLVYPYGDLLSDTYHNVCLLLKIVNFDMSNSLSAQPMLD